MGPCAEGLQSHHPAGNHLAARLLGPHRICVREVFNFAETAQFRCNGDAWAVRDLSRDAGTIGFPDSVQKERGQGFAPGGAFGVGAGGGNLMMTSPGWASCSSSRAMRRMVWGSVFKSCFSRWSAPFSLFKRSSSLVTF